MKNGDNDENKGASRYGYARFGLSSPDGAWTFGNNGVVNEENPMPCSEADSKDMEYVGKVFEFIDENEEIFNTDKIFTEGFSQNSMFSAYIGFCYSDRVTGIWQGGSGLAFKSQENVNLPGMQSKCSASSYAENKKDCEEVEPCTDCEYWPIYPCYESTKPMIDCIADYNNDNIANARAELGDPEIESTAVNMYTVAKTEGHDARLLRFKPSDDGTIAGGHKNPRNTVYWQMGCWGMTEKCSSECETSFEACVNGKDVSTAENRVDSFSTCIDHDSFIQLGGCDSTCSPTLEMLKQSEVPYKTDFAYDVFGANDQGSQPQPEFSKCKA
uniref:Uncharacterized protein n=2 Tax=Clytia hemisphaerica TaxID=252671 RepID=A0A7M5UFV2_9CNID